MKATVFKHPKTKKGWFSFGTIIVVLLLGNWPMIPLFNQDILIFGFPLMMLWSIILIFVTTLVMAIINKIGGID